MHLFFLSIHHCVFYHDKISIKIVGNTQKNRAEIPIKIDMGINKNILVP